MENLTTISQSQQLEKLWGKSHKTPRRFDRVRIQFSQFFQRLFQFSTLQPPRVWQTQHPEYKCWNAYDPVSGCRVKGLSESEMRAWLEDRYNR
ncbi:MAG: hypothetical protein WBA13_05720 [Microcoleaceae cyanobacterium]